MPNRLAAEHSPYLLQHLDNPVDWYPWGEEAFARARAEDKPIFLSVGYSTCHWCHVMAHESFEDPAVADALNRDFVSVKVDREERPDVDRVYMTFVQSTTGGGGWPMSVWLTPALEPFYGGTYFPPVSRWNRPGFVDILAEIARVWRDERDKVLNSAHAIVERLQTLTTRAAARADVPGPGVLDRAVQEFAAAYDEPRGGFGAAPKFPRPSELLFLLREHARTGAGRPLEMALGTLQAIARGGMRDHLGGGFHRYSVDADWRVPHFEKMLYDQAQLTWAFAEAAQAARDPRYLEVALDTLDYVRRDLRDPGGGFYSAEDADSVPFEQVGEDHPRSSEGAFYIWRDDEIQEALGEDAGLARLRYGVSPTGNAPFDPHGEFTGRNLLYLARGVDQIARDVSRPVEEVQRALDRVRATLVARRRMRPRPHLDDKVITAWNGLAMGAFARVSRVLASDVLPDDQDRQQMYLLEARRAAAFAREHLWDEATATLKRRFRVGHSGVAGYAEDYACLVFGLLELFQADGDPAWLTWAIELQRRQDELFWDSEHGGWFSTTAADRSVVLRLKDDHDGAEPAASSMAVQNLLVLSHLTRPDASRVEQIERTLGTFAGRAGSGRAMPMMLAALSSYHAGVTQLVIVGEPDERATRSLMRTAAEAYHPATLVVPVCVRHRESLERLLPWIATMEAPRGSAVAYLCRGLTCLAPATSPDELRRQLSGSGAPS